MHSARLYALANELDRIADRYGCEDFHRFRENRTPNDVVRFEIRSLHTTIVSLQCGNGYVQILPYRPEVVVV